MRVRNESRLEISGRLLHLNASNLVAARGSRNRPTNFDGAMMSALVFKPKRPVQECGGRNYVKSQDITYPVFWTCLQSPTWWVVGTTLNTHDRILL